MKPIKGHGLRGEGRVFIEDLRYQVEDARRPRMTFDQHGRGLCQCGAWSPVLPSTNARKAWHREQHKPAVLAELGGGA